MRIGKLLIFGVIAYLAGVVYFFPAAPIVDRIRPQLEPLVLSGVHGKLFNGTIDTVFSADDLLPLQFTDVQWTLAPTTLLRGGAGAKIRFNAYGGQGQGLVAQQWNGNLRISDFTFDAQASALQSLLPVPLASFSGRLSGDIGNMTLVNQALAQMTGELIWADALLETPMRASLGQLQLNIVPEGEQSHMLTLSAAGGDVSIDGTVTLTQSGDFSADMIFTPAATASAELLSGLRQLGRPDAQGRVRLVRQGNVNRLM